MMHQLYLIPILLQIAELMKELPEAHAGFQDVCLVLERLLPLLKAKRPLSEEELVVVESSCLEIGTLYPRVFGGTVPPKVHDMVFHLPRLARHQGTVGVREDGLEAKDAIGNGLRRRLACVRAEEERLRLMLQLDEVQMQVNASQCTARIGRRRQAQVASFINLRLLKF